MISTPFGDVLEEILMDAFLNGLRVEIRVKVKLFLPHSLEDAMKKA